MRGHVGTQPSSCWGVLLLKAEMHEMHEALLSRDFGCSRAGRDCLHLQRYICMPGNVLTTLCIIWKVIIIRNIEVGEGLYAAQSWHVTVGATGSQPSGLAGMHHWWHAG